MPTTVTLEAIKDWDNFPIELIDYSISLKRASDGYQISIEMEIAETIVAGAIVGTCIQKTEQSRYQEAAVCVQGAASDEDGVLMSGGVTAHLIPGSRYSVDGTTEGHRPIKFKSTGISVAPNNK